LYLNEAIVASSVAFLEASKNLLKHLLSFGGVVGLWEFCVSTLSLSLVWVSF
jgi:hypothetical protein